MSSTYRADVDGLRAVAILPVVAFHAQVGASGGYVGVDVFFVISGFLITGIIWSEIEQGSFTLRSFYERRIRRIFPAFMVMLALLTVASLLVLSPSELASYGKRLLATLAFASNFKFLREAEYFASDSEVNPLLHMWSLSVEEQFYIVFPLLLVVLFRVGLRPQIWIAVVFAGSLAASCWFVRTHPAETFYLLPTRAWELAMGSLLALGAIPKIRGRGPNEALAAIGLACIALAVFGFDDTIVFPGGAAILPCIGAAMIIHSGHTPTLVGGLLSKRPIVYIGLISYALYLYHWPLLVFARYLSPGSPVAIAIAVALAFALAAASLHFIETPIRKKRIVGTRRAVFVLGALGVAVFAIAAVGFVITKGLPRRFGLDKAFYAEIATTKKRALESYRWGECFFDSSKQPDAFDPKRCLAGGTLLIGDSHAAHLYPGVRTRWPDASYLASGGCRPLVGTITRADKSCRFVHAYWFEQLLSRHWNTIVVAGQWEPADLPALRETLPMLSAAADNVILVGPSLDYRGLFPELLAIDHGATLHAKIKPRVFVMDRAMRALGDKHVQYVSMVDAICPNATCAVTTPGGRYLHWDSSHLTPEASKWVVSRWVLAQ